MLNRLIFGHHRYGEPVAHQLYLKRCKVMLLKYEKTHNQEYLIDAANYCLLEIHCPSSRDTYFKSEDSQGRNE